MTHLIKSAPSESVIAGEKIFQKLGCNQCHFAQYTTIQVDEFPELSNQVIRPYTDLLLHDMGSALADFTLGPSNEPAQNKNVEFQATTHEWRTAPLWGLGLTQTVNPDATFLHDGRARTIMEAILWHGGEAELSRKKVLALNEQERYQLIEFLEDL